MKVTRLCQGYRIRLSDAELGMLKWLVVDGVVAGEGDDFAQSAWAPAEKAALTRRVTRHGSYGILATDEDRRK